MKKKLFFFAFALIVSAQTSEIPVYSPFLSYQSPALRPYYSFDFSSIVREIPFVYSPTPTFCYRSELLDFKTSTTKVDFQERTSAKIWIKPSSVEASMDFSFQRDPWPELKGMQEKIQIKMSFEKHF